MKLKTIGVITGVLIIITLVFTPYEIRLFNADTTYMYLLNFKEICLFVFGLLIGRLGNK